MAKSLKLDVVTPDRVVLSEEVEYVSAPGVEGEFGVLPEHASLLAALGIGGLGFDQKGKRRRAFVSGGFLEVSDNKVTVLAESSELVENIDLVRAEEARRRAELRLAGQAGDVNLVRAQSALHRAIARISVSRESHS